MFPILCVVIGCSFPMIYSWIFKNLLCSVHFGLSFLNVCASILENLDCVVSTNDRLALKFNSRIEK
jgi:hypothetical protein